MKPIRQRFKEACLPAAIFAAVLLLLLATSDVGFVRDEGFYFHAARLYAGWFRELWANLIVGDLFRSFSQESIDRHWSYNPEHPVVMKASFALSHLIFHELLGWMSPSTAWRFPTMISAAALVTGVYLFGRDLGRRYLQAPWAPISFGLIAALALLLQPRFFFHCHLATFDTAITSLWFWVVYAYWRSFDSRRWAIAAGALFGLALSVKLNAFFLPLVLVGHWVLLHIWEFRLQRGEEGRLVLAFPKIPAAFWAMAVAGPLLFYALWPRHWFETFSRVQWYLNFHLTHEHYMVQYFGQNLQIPPFPISFPFVMTLVTVPATLLLAALIGAAFALKSSEAPKEFRAVLEDLRRRRWPRHSDREDRRGARLLLFINLLFPIALIAMPETPIFGGTKHWMPAMPYLALFAGWGITALALSLKPWLSDRLPLSEERAALAAALLLALFTLLPAAYATAHNHPMGTAYYNELIGGYRGAAEKEMMPQFWGYASRQALPWLNEAAPPESSVWIHKILSPAWEAYQAEEIARRDLKTASIRRSDYALYHQQKAFMHLLLPLWEEYRTMAPAHVVEIDGVPLHSVYERPEKEELKFPEVWR